MESDSFAEAIEELNLEGLGEDASDHALVEELFAQIQDVPLDILKADINWVDIHILQLMEQAPDVPTAMTWMCHIYRGLYEQDRGEANLGV